MNDPAAWARLQHTMLTAYSSLLRILDGAYLEGFTIPLEENLLLEDGAMLAADS
jgi:hypothetical protein